MKKILMLAITGSLLSTSALAQTDTTKTETEWSSDKSNGGWQEKFGNKMTEKVQKFKDKKNAPVDATTTRSIMMIAGEWPENNKVVTYTPYGSSGMLQGGQYIYIKMVKGNGGYVNEIHTGYYLNEDKSIKDPEVWEGYSSDLYTGNLWYFKEPFSFEYWVTNSGRIYLTENSLVAYKVVDKTTEEVKDISVIAGKKGKNEGTWKKEIEAYRRFALDKQVEDAAIIKKAEADFRAEHSLENKEVTDIKVEYLYGEGEEGAEVGSYVYVGLVVTLADGTVDKTHNIGGNLYIEDFIDASEDLNKDYKKDKYGGNCHCGSGGLSVEGNKAPGERDIYTTTIKPKYAGDASVTITLPLVYRTTVERSSPGGTYDIEIKTTKHTETGEELNYVKFRKGDYAKIKLDGTLDVSVAGTTGMTGSDGKDCYKEWCTAGDSGDGGDGSDGGDVSVVKTSDVKRLKINLYAYAGGAGMPGMKGHALGDNGTDGKMGEMGSPGASGYTSEKVGTVKF